MSTFKASKTMTDFMRSNKYVRLLAGPIGGGKSVCCTHELLRWATEQKPNDKGERKTRFLICRNTADQLRSTTCKTVFDWLPPGEAGVWKATEKTFYIEAGLPDGTIVKSEWQFIALDTPDDVRKALSLEATGLWGNECRELHPDVVDGLLMRVNRYPSMKDGGATRAGAIFDTNMPGEDTWWQDKMDNPPTNWDIYIQPPGVLPIETYRDTFDAEPAENQIAVDKDGDIYAVNPASDNYDNLAKDYYPNTLEGKTKDFINVYLRCKFGRSLSGQPVFQSFNSDMHVAKEELRPIPGTSVIIGVDAGLSPAATVCQVTYDGRVIVHDALISESMGALRFIREKLKPLITNKFAGYRVQIVIDPAAYQRAQTDERCVADMFKQEGFQVTPARTNSISARLAAVENYMTRVVDGKPGILINPSANPLIVALRGKYCYKVNTKGEVAETPDKTHPHSDIADSLQYACLHADSGFLGAKIGSGRREVKPAPMRFV